MDHIGIDVHKRESQIYILAADGAMLERRIRTEGERFAALLGDLLDRDLFPPAEAAWIRQHVPRTALDLRQLGRAPYVVEPYLEHEGLGVVFSRDLTPRVRRRVRRADVVFQ